MDQFLPYVSRDTPCPDPRPPRTPTSTSPAAGSLNHPQRRTGPPVETQAQAQRPAQAKPQADQTSPYDPTENEKGEFPPS